MAQRSGRDRHDMWAEMPPSGKNKPTVSFDGGQQKNKPEKGAEDSASRRAKPAADKTAASGAVKGRQTKGRKAAAASKGKPEKRTAAPKNVMYLNEDNSSDIPIAKPIDIQERALKGKGKRRTKERREDAVGRRSRKRPLSSYLLYIIVFGTLAVVLVCVLSTTVLFNVTKITVKGETIYSDSEVIESCGVRNGENLVLMDAASVEETLINALPYVDKVTVNKLFTSSTLEIVLNQATPLANIQKDKEYYLISENGRIMNSQLSKPDAKYIVVTGFDPEFAVSGDFISVADEGGRNYLAKLAKCVKTYAGLVEEDEIGVGQKPDILYELISAYKQVGLEKKIKEIDISNIYDLKLNYDDKLLLNLGEITDAKIKLTIAKNLIDKGEFEGEKGTLDLSLAADPSHNMKVTFRGEYENSGTEDDDKEDSGADSDSDTDSSDSSDNSDEPTIGDTTDPEE